ncbi:MAG: hypothetical protein PWQ08_1101 [Clostridiales bacterium]|nr:hypothetical protein [Clostridiales bacterium]
MNEQAKKIYESKSSLCAPGSHFPAFYLTRLEHPAMMELYRSWCQAHGIRASMPPSDAERIEFELSLFRPEVVQELTDYAGWVEKQRERTGTALLDQHRRPSMQLDRQNKK